MSNNDLIIETITPSVAADYLNKNDDNRKLRQNRVDQYAAAMERGMWHFTGDPIVFDYYGRLLQGQHRLAACVKANVPFVTAVLRNADPAMYGILDSGLNRSAADGVSHAGVKSAPSVAAIARQVLGLRAGCLLDTNRMQVAVLREDIVEFCVKNDEQLVDAYNWASKIRYAIGVGITPVGTFIYLVNEVEGSDRLHEFFDAVVSGEGLHRGDPRLAYRNWASGGLSQQARDRSIAHLASTIRAWNAFVLGEELLIMKNWRRGLTFPAIRHDAEF